MDELSNLTELVEDGNGRLMPYHGHMVYRKPRFVPYYDDKADFTTNAVDYYNYLSMFEHWLELMRKKINSLLDRDITFTDTDTIDFTKIGDWQLKQNMITVSAAVKISRDTLNAIKKGSDGALYVKDLEPRVEALEKRANDYDAMFDQIWTEINNIKGDIIDIKADINDIKEEIKNIKIRLDNLEKEFLDLRQRVIALEGEVAKIWREIDLIRGILEDLQEQINALRGNVRFTRLVKGTDYTLTFYNGFYTDTTDVTISFAETLSMAYLRLGMTLSDGNLLRNPNMKNVELRHGNSIANAPKSRIIGINFIGEYARLNALLASETYSNVWNMRPVSARASWSGLITLSPRATGQLPLCLSLVSYFDGYNSQFTVYNDLVPDALELNDTTVNTMITMYK